MLKKNIKNYTFSSLLLIIVNAIALLSGALGWKWQLLIVGSIYFIAILFYNKRWGGIRPVFWSIGVITPFLIIYGGFAFSEKLAHVYPIPIIAFLSSVFAYFIRKSRIKHIIMYVYLSFLIFLSYWAYPNYLVFVFNKGSKTVENLKVSSNIYFLDNNKDTICFNSLRNKILVIDVWNSACGSCIRGFPNFEKVYQTYKNNSNIYIFSVNMKLKRDSLDSVIKFTNQFNYNFPFLFTNDLIAKYFLDSVKIKFVPSVVVIDSGGRIKYKGSLIMDPKIRIHNVFDIVDGLLHSRSYTFGNK